MTDKHTIKVKIFGAEYQIKGEADPAYMESLAKLVDEKMREVGQPGGVQASRAAILSAINIMDELTRTRKSLEEERQRYDQTARLVASLDLKLQEVLASQEAPEPPALAAFEADPLPETPPPLPPTPAPEDEVTP